MASITGTALNTAFGLNIASLMFALLSLIPIIRLSIKTPNINAIQLILISMEFSLSFLQFLGFFYISADKPQSLVPFSSYFTVNSTGANALGIIYVLIFFSYLLCLMISNYHITHMFKHYRPVKLGLLTLKYALINAASVVGLTIGAYFTDSIGMNNFTFYGLRSGSVFGVVAASLIAFIGVLSILTFFFVCWVRGERIKASITKDPFSRSLQNSLIVVTFIPSLVFSLLMLPYCAFLIENYVNRSSSSTLSEYVGIFLCFYVSLPWVMAIARLLESNFRTYFFGMIFPFNCRMRHLLWPDIIQNGKKLDLFTGKKPPKDATVTISQSVLDLSHINVSQDNVNHDISARYANITKEISLVTTNKPDIAESRAVKILPRHANISHKDLQCILITICRLLSNIEFDTEPLRRLERPPWKHLYYTEIKVLRFEHMTLVLNETSRLQTEENEPMSELTTGIEIAPRVFNHLGDMWDITRASIQKSFGAFSNPNCLAAFAKKTFPRGIYDRFQAASSNKEFVIRLLEKEEKFDLQESFLEIYHASCYQKRRACKQSLIPKIFGVFFVENKHIRCNVILQENPYKSFYIYPQDNLPFNLKQRYTLDGKHLSREDFDMEAKTITKIKISSQDFEGFAQKRLFEIRGADKRLLLSELSEDMEILIKGGIRDFRVVMALSPVVKCEELRNPGTLFTVDRRFFVKVFVDIRSYRNTRNILLPEKLENLNFTKNEPRVYSQFLLHCLDKLL